MSARESVIPVFVPHLGCPNDCVFCDQRRISGAASPATAEDVRRAVEAAAASSANNGGGRQLAFYGGSFTAIPAWQQEELLGAAQPYLADGTLSSLRLSTRPDAIDGEVLARLRRCGVRTVEDAVRVCARILPVFEAAGIPVIRLGLNPTEELSGGQAAGGAYHPALGELVRARIMRSRAEELLAGAEPGARAALYVEPRLMSQAVGQHGENRAWLKEKFGLKELKILPREGVKGLMRAE